MKPFNRFIACVLVLPTCLLFVPSTGLCTEKQPPAKTEKRTITRHDPKVMASPEKQMTPKQAAQAKKKKSNWLWIGLGAAAVVALAALPIGGGSGDDPPPPEEGDITVEW